MSKSYKDYLDDLNESLDKEGANALTRDQLAKELERIEKEYQAALEDASSGGTELPEVPKYDRLEYDAPTDEELAAQAESALSDYKNTGLGNIESETDAAKKAKEEEKRAAAAAAEKRAEAVGAGYDGAAVAFENDALKRGLARSSIAANKSAGLAAGKAEALAQAAADAEEAARGIESEIAALEAGRTKALDSFNIAYAAKLTEKIAALAEARDKKAAEVLKYNNSLLELERKAANERAELENKLNKDAPKVDTSEALGTRNNAKYNAIRSYLSGLSKSDAAAALTNDANFRNALTDYYYYKLVNEFAA